jgi:hypothetical protein
VSQQIIAAVAITWAVVAMILVVVPPDGTQKPLDAKYNLRRLRKLLRVVAFLH